MAPNNSYIVKIQGEEEFRTGVYYEVDLSQSPIGEGGMGRVYKGVRIDTSSGIKRPVAVKFLYDGLPQNVLDRAIREASIKIKCENLIEMIAFVNMQQQEANGAVVNHYHVISELLDGVMLHDLVKGKTTDPIGNEIAYAREMYALYQKDRQAFVIEITKKVLAGLGYLHDTGYVHRDIDPSNIMLTADRKIKLIDFGVAHKMEVQQSGPLLTRVGSFLGKAEYAAPELVLGDVFHQNATTDIYAVGILMFQLLTGSLPFTGSLQDVMQMQREMDVPVNAINDKKLRGIVAKATAKKQSERYQSCAEFRVALDGVSKKSKSFEKTKIQEPAINPYSSRRREEAYTETVIADNKQTGQTKIVSSIHETNSGDLNDRSNIYVAIIIAVGGLLCGALLAYIFI